MKEFLRRVKKTRSCWVWTGRVNACGYGTFGKSWLAHRWSYRFIGGKELPPELHHTCKVRRCVNPKHLQPVTPDSHPDKPSVINLTKTHCPFGHPYSGENLYVDRIGHRHCRVCRRSAANRAYYNNWAKNRAAQAAYYRRKKAGMR